MKTLITESIADQTVSFEYYDRIHENNVDVVAYFLRVMAQGIEDGIVNPVLILKPKVWEFLVVRCANKIIGLTVWENTEASDVRARFIEVTPEWRGTPVFMKIRRYQIALLKSQGKHSLFGYFEKNNLRSISAHRKLGYEIDTSYIDSKFIRMRVWVNNMSAA